jgi:hypothetical protein
MGKGLADKIFGALEANQEKMRISREEARRIARVRALVGDILTAAGCFQGQASSSVAEGKTDRTRSWFHIEDIPK